MKLIMALAAAVSLQGAVTLLTDLNSFVAQTGPNTVSTFEEVTAGTAAPVISAGATFSSSTGMVINSLVNLPHSFWFGTAGTAPNFFGVLLNYNVSLPSDQNAFGVLMSCFGCEGPNDTRISWTLFSGPFGTGTVVDAGSQIIDLTNNSEGIPRFLGIISPLPFRSIAITKVQASSGFGGGTYVIDDFRFATLSGSGGSIAHIATGNGWQTTFVLVNPGTSAAQVHLKFFADNGSPLSLPLVFPQSGSATTSIASSVDQPLAAGATLIVQSAKPVLDPAPTVGSAQLASSGNVGGFVIFRFNPSLQEAVVPMESRNANGYILAFDNTGGTATGVAINNVSSQAANVPVMIRDENGAQIAAGILNLAANGHLAFTLGTERYPAAATIRGTIEFDTPVGGQIGVLGIRIPTERTYTTLPALAK